jgi:uncharacterized repeat protein (TIGR03803 family)
VPHGKEDKPMHSKTHSHGSIFGMHWDPTNAALAILPVLLFLILLIMSLTLTAQPAMGQTFTVIHNFTGHQDGYYSTAAVAIDRAGNLYGTTQFGGNGYGGVFQLKPRNGGWLFNPIYSFAGFPDGFNPSAPITIGPNGTLYSSAFGGGLHNEGAIFNVTPPPTACTTALCTWRETLLYSFDYNDGAGPQSAVIFDPAGNIYGAVPAGGNAGCMEGCGVVFKLTPSGGGWIETDYMFTGGSDGGNPLGGVIQGSDGSLYGTTLYGGAYGSGTVYQLIPSGSGWTETTIHDFQDSSEGYDAFAGLAADESGNLYGATCYGGPNNAGSVFELTPSNGSWTFTLLYTFPGESPANPLRGPSATSFSPTAISMAPLWPMVLMAGARHLS